MGAEVGIIIPVYNGMPYLSQAVSSVWAQRFGAFDLYLVDDGSTDGSRAWIQACDEPRTHKIYNEQNLGLYPTLRRTIERISNPWIVILMQDDRLLPSYLDEMLRLVSLYPAMDAFWATQDTIDQYNQVLYRGLTTRRIEIIEPGNTAWHSGLLRGCFWVISGSMTRHTLLQAVPFARTYPHASDFDWMLRMLRRAPLLYFEMTLSQVRVHSAQSSTRNLASAQDVIESCEIVCGDVLRHARELETAQVTALVNARVRAIFWRLLSALYHGQWSAVPPLLTCAQRYLGLRSIHVRAHNSEKLA